MTHRYGDTPPGSPAARARGCKCPVIDNQYGKGAYVDSAGRPGFWTNPKCPLPLHGESEVKKA